MPSLYNCKHDGDQFRITKFDSDFNVEASYLCDLVSCECPAGHRPRCRHREMLPKFIQRNHIGDNWFYDHDRGGWVQGAGFEPQPLPDQPEQKQVAYVNHTIRSKEELEAFKELSKTFIPATVQPFQLGGFPYDCYDNLCTTPTDCILNGCAKGNGKPSRRLAPEGLGQPSDTEPSLDRAMGTDADSWASLEKAIPSTFPTIRRRV